MSDVDYDTMRQRVHDSIAEIVNEEDEDAALITGWILIFETADLDTKRSLTVLTGNATGEESISPWVGEGYLHHVANNYEVYDNFDWLEDFDEDDD